MSVAILLLRRYLYVPTVAYTDSGAYRYWSLSRRELEGAGVVGSFVWIWFPEAETAIVSGRRFNEAGDGGGPGLSAFPPSVGRGRRCLTSSPEVYCTLDQSGSQIRSFSVVALLWLLSSIPYVENCSVALGVSLSQHGGGLNW